MQTLLIVLGSLLAVALVYVIVIRPWHLCWGATTAERITPGDELVQEPHVQATRGISIKASADDVWPWLAVMVTGPTGGIAVEGIEPNRYLVMWLRNDWCSISRVYVLDPIDYRTTRLLVRTRVRVTNGLRAILCYPLFEISDFVFTRRLLLDVKRRAEETQRVSSKTPARSEE